MVSDLPPPPPAFVSWLCGLWGRAPFTPTPLCPNLCLLGQTLSKHRPCPAWQQGQTHGHCSNLTVFAEHLLCSTGLQQAGRGLCVHRSKGMEMLTVDAPAWREGPSLPSHVLRQGPQRQLPWGSGGGGVWGKLEVPGVAAAGDTQCLLCWEGSHSPPGETVAPSPGGRCGNKGTETSPCSRSTKI